jgi:hypothetical protein
MNTLKKQFSDALKREGKIITIYYTSESVKCLFKINKDYNKTDNHITIFYDIDSPIKQGQLLTYGGKNYLTLNQESVENDTYYKSSLLECNLEIPVIINSVTRNIPCYSYELSSAYTVGNNYITLADGKGELITELIDGLSTTAYIDKGFRIMGGYYKVANMYNLVGISHLMIERELTPPDEYALEITTELSDYKVGETATITANPTINDTPQTGQTITYISSDETLATVDASGLITFLGVGTVTITGIWVEHSETKDTLSLIISEADAPPVENTLTIEADGDELIMGTSTPTTFTPTLKDGNGNAVDFTAVWTFNYNGMPKNYFVITYVGNQCKVKAIDEIYDAIGKTLVLTCTTSDGVASGIYEIMVTSGW